MTTGSCTCFRCWVTDFDGYLTRFAIRVYEARKARPRTEKILSNLNFGKGFGKWKSVIVGRVVFQFDQQWYTVKQVADRLQMSAGTVTKIFEEWLGDGVIDAAAEHSAKGHVRRHLRISSNALERFLRLRGQLSPLTQ